jgi:hypothetical protein
MHLETVTGPPLAVTTLRRRRETDGHSGEAGMASNGIASDASAGVRLK